MAPYIRTRDGLYAWIVCVSAVSVIILLFGNTQNFGLILPTLLDEFHESKAKTAWVGSLALALPLSLSPVAARLINRFGARRVGIVGSIISALGLMLTSFVNGIPLMYVTLSLVYGVGASLPYTACYDIVPKYFKKRVSLAMGAMVSGVGATIFVMSPVNEALITNLGWRKAYLVFAGFSLLAGVCCLTFSPHVEQDHMEITVESNSKEQMCQPLPLYKNCRFLISCVYSFLFQEGNIIPLFHLGRYALDSGLSPTQTANLYVGYGILSVIGRLLSGKICESRSFLASNICCLLAAFVAGTGNILVPFMKGFPEFMIYFCFNGLADGFHVSGNNVVVMEVCSMQQRTTAFGYLFFATSLAFLSGPPIGGLIADQGGSYIPIFYASGSIVLFSGLVILTIKCFKKKTNVANLEYENTKRQEKGIFREIFYWKSLRRNKLLPSNNLSMGQTDRQIEYGQKEKETDRQTDGQTAEYGQREKEETDKWTSRYP